VCVCRARVGNPQTVDITIRKKAKAFWPFLLAGGKAANKLKHMETDWDRCVRAGTPKQLFVLAGAHAFTVNLICTRLS